MATYQSQYTGEQIDEAVGRVLAGGNGNTDAGDKALLVFYNKSVSGRTIRAYFDNEGTGVSQASFSTTDRIIYLTGFSNYVYFKGANKDDIYDSVSGKAVNCDVEFIKTGNTSAWSQIMKVTNIKGIGIITITPSNEPVAPDDVPPV